MTRSRPLFWSMVAAFAVIITRSFTWCVPLGVDESDYMLRGFEWLQGAHLYAGLQSNRPPLLYVVFGLVGAVARAASLDPGVTLRAASAIAMAITVGMFVWTLLPRTRPVAVLAGAVCFVALSASLSIEGVDANAEHWMVLPWTASTLLLVRLVGENSAGNQDRWRALAAGVLLGLAVLIKQVAIVGAVVPLGLWLCDRRRLEFWRVTSVWFAIGGLCVGAAALVAAGLNGEIAEMIVFGSNTFYASLPTVIAPWVLAAQRLLGYWALITLLVLFSVSCVVVALVRGPARRTDATSLVALAWIGAASLAVILPGRYYPHYFVMLVGPLALVVALAVDGALESSRGPLRTISLGLLGLLLALQGAYVVLGYRSLDSYASIKMAGPTVARAIKEHFPFGTPVFVWGGDSAPLVYSGYRPAYRELWAYYPLKNFGRRNGTSILGVRLENLGDQLLGDFRVRPAEAVVLMRPLAGPSYVFGLDPADDDVRVAQMLSYRLQTDYELVETLDTPVGRITLWSLAAETR